MGAEEFYVTCTGETAKSAFDKAVKRARYDHGHTGYTGTIAEKDSFVMIVLDVNAVIKKLDELGEWYKETLTDLESRLAKEKDGMYPLIGLPGDRISWAGSAGAKARAERLRSLISDIPKRKEQALKGVMDVDLAKEFAEILIDTRDERIDDKWGPAGCIEIGEVKGKKPFKEYLFFGWASS